MKKTESKIEIPVLILLCIAGLCVIIIIAGTIFALAGKIGAGETAAGTPVPGYEEDRAFLDTGRLRIELESDDGTTSVLVVKAALPYRKTDSAFREELVKNLPEIKSIITGVFSSMDSGEIQDKGEKALRQEVIDKINGILVLGELEEIYFEEFIFFD